VLLALLLALPMPSAAPAATMRAAAPRPAARVARPDPGTPPRARPPGRQLEDIHIEGEIPVPQVLFVTARDQRRFLDFGHGRYLRTSRQLAEQTPIPSWIQVTATSPAKESNR
jgi:hypothetical protein